MGNFDQHIQEHAVGRAGPDGRSSAETGRLGAVRAFARRWAPAHVPIAYKLAFAIALVITLGMLGLGTLIVYNQTRLLQEQINAFGSTIIGQMAASAQEPLLANDTLALEVLTANLGSAERALGAAIYGSKGEILTQAGITPFMDHAPFHDYSGLYLSKEAKTMEWSWRQSPRGAINAVSFISPVIFQDVTAGHVLITFSRKALDRSLRESVRAVGVATALMILIGAFSSFMLGRRLSRPIHHLVDASRAIRDGQLDYRILERRNDEIGLLMTSFNSMAAGLLRKSQVESALERYLSPTVAREVMANLEQVELGGRHVTATALFADIVGFTRMSEQMSPADVAALLNEYFHYVSGVSELYEGIIDKYMGDCAMLLFGAPEPDPEHCFHAIACAVALQRVTAHLNERRLALGQLPVHFRMGLNTGGMVAGNLGTRERMQYTVVGDAVNLASRLCGVAGAGQIVISDAIYGLPGMPERVRASAHESIQVRGKTDPVQTYLVEALQPPYDEELEQRIAQVLATVPGGLQQ